MKNIRRITGFLLVVVLLQGLALLFLTPEGLEIIYQIPLRIQAERFKPENNTYVVYYDTRVDIAEADLVVVGADGNIAESYDILGHFTRFLKQFNNLSAVMLDFDQTEETIVTEMMDETSEAQFSESLDNIRENSDIPQDYCDYLSELVVVNKTMPPVRKFDLVSYSSDADSTATLAERIAETYTSTERSALCVVDAKELSQESELTDELDSLLSDKDIIYIKIMYTASCPSADTHETVRFLLENDEPSVYFVENEDFSSFYKFYNAVTGLYGTNRTMENRLDTRFTDYYFVVSGGTLAQ